MQSRVFLLQLPHHIKFPQCCVHAVSFFLRYPVQQQLKIAKRNESIDLQTPTPKLKAAIFQLISILIEIDPENTVIGLETEGFLDVLMR